ncbi:MAG: hypothetical protein IT385_08640 [Deltaproteobacteria bacterium]|nr:hypothetical protein [Deltaproteobacteria bacterium]
MKFEAGRYWFVTRRALGRQFFLKPEPWVRELFAYATARAAGETGVCVIGGVCMSSHYHLVVFDPTGDLPRFVQLLNELVARAGNAEWGRGDYFFESPGPHYLPLLTAESIEEMLVYALANPCEARLVARSRAWGGWQTRPEELGTAREVMRPAITFFSERSGSPGSERLELHLPETHAHLGAEGFRSRIAGRLKAREDELIAEHGARCLGMDKVLSFHWTENASAYEPRREGKPRSKTGQVEHAREIHESYGAELEVFWAAHREAYELMRSGERAVFPYGTYYWRVFGGQSCADPPGGNRAVRC